MKVKLYSKILIALVLSFLVSSVAIKEVFVANSPKIREDLPSYLAFRITDLFEQKTAIAKKQLQETPPPQQQLQSVSFQVLFKGVSAKSNTTTTYTVIKEGEVEWVEYTFHLNDGREIKIKVPKGEKPPNPRDIENRF